jgi:hypothetical protein
VSFGVVSCIYVHIALKLSRKANMPSDKESKEVRDPAALELFKSLGLDSKTAQNAVANPKVTANLTDVVREAGVAQGCDKSIGNLLYTVCSCSFFSAGFV